jgi:diguanylate cyclase (GGDEF)-like protein
MEILKSVADNGIARQHNARFKVKPPPKAFNNPLHLLFIIAVSMFLAQMIVVYILLALPPLPDYKEALLIASLHTCIVLPVLYCFIYRPFRRHLNERRRLEKELRTISITDELTGIFNRRGFYVLAQKHLEIAKRKKRKFSILFLDLDDLKNINDEFGHSTGDQALIDTANILKKSFRTSDVIARIGGDEFSVLITEPSSLGNIQHIISANIQEKLDEYNNQSDRVYKLTLSIGMSHFRPKHPSSIDELLARADKLMYEQKKKHKDSQMNDLATTFA